jgi:hypothetical protein
LEYPDRASYLEEDREVRFYADIFKRLEDASMDTEQSLKLITKLSGRKRG